MAAAACRFCATALEHGFVDLGMSPLSNAFLDADALNRMERFYPLHAYVCEECFLVQLEEFESPGEIFRDYSYFSSYSDSCARTRSRVRRGDNGSIRARREVIGSRDCE